MNLMKLPQAFTVCQIPNTSEIDLSKGVVFFSRTDEELSLVCETEYVPQHTLAREDGWRGFRVCGVLDFSLVGILAQISGILAEQGISIFAVSTYNTDYIFTKVDVFDRAIETLADAGYAILE